MCPIVALNLALIIWFSLGNGKNYPYTDGATLYSRAAVVRVRVGEVMNVQMHIVIIFPALTVLGM